MESIVKWFKSIPPGIMTKIIVVGVTLLAGIVVVRLIGFLIQRFIMKKATMQTRMLVRKAIFYAGAVTIIMIILSELGVKIGTLLGAAGIVGVAVGFASQASVSNIISGVFLISEKPFAVGDVIRIGDKTGIILSIDLLSIKIRTFDNLFIRIPNEKILNSEVTNITRFPIRRMDIVVQVAYKEDVGKVKRVLLEIAKNNPFCLDEPEPLILFQNFQESGLEFLFAVWFEKNDFVNLKNSIMQDIKERFDAEKIELPFPHRAIYSGSRTQPFPIRIVNDNENNLQK